jgi:hypothetical protein
VNKVNQARALRIWLSLGATAALGVALGCGEIGGAGQCFGVEVTGACVTIDSVVLTDTINNVDTSSVDAFQTADCDGDLSTIDAEPFGAHSAKVTFTVTLMPGVTSPPAPAFVTYTGYTIEYVESPTNLVTAPPLSTQIFAMRLKVDADSSVTDTVPFMLSQTKKEYRDGDGSRVPSASYTAIYTFIGTTQFLQDVVVKGSTAFTIGGFDNCG